MSLWLRKQAIIIIFHSELSDSQRKVVSQKEEELLTGIARPIVLLKKKKAIVLPGEMETVLLTESKIAESVENIQISVEEQV